MSLAHFAGAGMVAVGDYAIPCDDRREAFDAIPNSEREALWQRLEVRGEEDRLEEAIQ
jgi:hypothetical protein